MKMTKEEFRERVLLDLQERKKLKDEQEKEVDLYFVRKIKKYARIKMNKKKRQKNREVTYD